MSNPYEILGVNENATDDEIKIKYRELVKKYHPDKYQNNPLSELAEEKLREVNIGMKNAEWYFLKGMILYKKGWYDDAIRNIQMAVNMEPNDMEYRNALNQMTMSGGGFRNTATGMGYGNTNDAFCRALQCYCCADMCCDCI